MRGTLHTAQKSLIDTCEKHADLKVSDYIKMSKVSRRQGRYSEIPVVELAAYAPLHNRIIQDNARKLGLGGPV